MVREDADDIMLHVATSWLTPTATYYAIFYEVLDLVVQQSTSY